MPTAHTAGLLGLFDLPLPFRASQVLFRQWLKSCQRATQHCFSGRSGLPAVVSTTRVSPILQHRPAWNPVLGCHVSVRREKALVFKTPVS